jgi:pyruvate kinase
LKFGLANDVDWIALSFVRTAQEILDIKKYIKEQGSMAKVIAKMEKPEAIDNMQSIIDATDGIMVARGDLGVELPSEDVPMIQKRMVEMSNLAAKPVIVATQMLESMIDNPRPTRAEVGDVANAVLDGADAVMLSAESASGKYPILSVETMVNTINQVEKQVEEKKLYFKHHTHVTEDSYKSKQKDNDNVVMAACRMARDLKVKALIGMTTSGYTAFRLSHHRPKANLFIFTANQKLLSQLSLYWGVTAFYFDKMKTLTADEAVEEIKQFLVDNGELVDGDSFINTLSVPLQKNNRTNTIKFSKVG